MFLRGCHRGHLACSAPRDRRQLPARVECIETRENVVVDADGNETTAPVVVPFKVMSASLSDGVLKGESAKAFEALRVVIEEDGGEAGRADLAFPRVF